MLDYLAAGNAVEDLALKECCEISSGHWNYCGVGRQTVAVCLVVRTPSQADG
jgi:hypothetical protein